MSQIQIITGAVILLAGLLHFENRNNTLGKVVFKFLLSSLFVTTAMIQPHPMPDYYHYVLVGLLLSLVGDICLALPQQVFFKAGLVAFLLGHMAYVLGFVRLTMPSSYLTLISPIIIAISLGVFSWLKPHLSDMKWPVLAYIVVITAMILTAAAAWQNLMLQESGRLLLLVGAINFYLSDLFVARDRFVKPGQINRVIGLPLYNAGQFMLAFSVGVLM